jgi:hypothetical protein
MGLGLNHFFLSVLSMQRAKKKKRNILCSKKETRDFVIPKPYCFGLPFLS